MFDDWGVIKLTTPVTTGDRLGRYTVNSYADMKDITYQTQGYPLDLNNGITWNNHNMYATSGKITGNYNRYLPVVTTDIDIFNGQSGSPVYSYRTNYGYTAEAIVVAGSYNENYLILINNYLTNLFSRL